MIYTNTQPSFGMVSEWQCNFIVHAGRVQWYMVNIPTEGSGNVTFPVELPEGATVTRAWLSMALSLPLSGSAYQRVNGLSIPSDGIVEIELPEGAKSFEAAFVFRANGILYQDIFQHSGRLSIIDPTLNIEYETAEETPPDGEEPAPEEPEEESRPLDTGVQLPRLLDGDLKERARIDPSRLSLTLNLHPLSTAIMDIPPGEPEVKVRDMLELFSPNGSVGLFRVTEVCDTFGNLSGQRVYLEHALATLADSLAIGTQAMSGPVAMVFSTLLDGQEVKNWVLGDCEIPEDFELVYEYSTESILKAIIGLTNMLPDGYAWEFDTLQYPFVMHLREMKTDNLCECRLNRNLSSVRRTLETNTLCTRLYAYGAGEGQDRVTLTNLIGQQYIDSDSVNTWGVVSKALYADNIFDALTLKDVAERFLSRYDKPKVSVEMDAMDLYRATGENLDYFKLGRTCRMPLPAYGVTLNERVIQIKYPDVFGNPENAVVTLANRIRTASDEIAELMREVTNSKLLGGTVETETKIGSYGRVTPESPLDVYYDIAGYGNVLNVRASYKATLNYDDSVVSCNLVVDGNEVPESEIIAHSADITRYLSKDENGVPTVGSHSVSFFPRTLIGDESTVRGTITIKTIEKR